MAGQNAIRQTAATLAAAAYKGVEGEAEALDHLWDLYLSFLRRFQAAQDLRELLPSEKAK